MFTCFFLVKSSFPKQQTGLKTNQALPLTLEGEGSVPARPCCSPQPARSRSAGVRPPPPAALCVALSICAIPMALLSWMNVSSLNEWWRLELQRNDRVFLGGVKPSYPFSPMDADLKLWGRGVIIPWGGHISYSTDSTTGCSF